MALVKCPECGCDVSTQAAACPSCGYPLRAPTPASPSRSPLESEQFWSRALLALGAWFVTPWIARLIVALAVLVVVVYFLIRGR